MVMKMMMTCRTKMKMRKTMMGRTRKRSQRQRRSTSGRSSLRSYPSSFLDGEETLTWNLTPSKWESTATPTSKSHFCWEISREWLRNRKALRLKSSLTRKANPRRISKIPTKKLERECQVKQDMLMEVMRLMSQSVNSTSTLSTRSVTRSHLPGQPAYSLWREQSRPRIWGMLSSTWQWPNSYDLLWLSISCKLTQNH
jgi:hypothetical protein